MSSGGIVDVTDEDKRRHREAERYLKEVSSPFAPG
jgi:guanine nucleotide-binding protein subunit alpha